MSLHHRDHQTDQNQCNPTLKENTPQQPDLAACSITALITNGMLQPLRTCLNHAPDFSNPISTLREAWPHLFRGMPLNVARGTLAFTSQSWVQGWVHAQYGKETTKGKVLGVLSAAAVGTGIALGVETWFIRRNRGLFGLRVTLPLAGFYLLREFGFSFYVLGSEHLSPEGKQVAMGCSTAATAWCHKKIVQHAVSGNVVRPVIQPPLSMTQRAGYAGNMFFWRAAYLNVYKNAYQHVRDDVTPEVLKRVRGR